MLYGITAYSDDTLGNWRRSGGLPGAGDLALQRAAESGKRRGAEKKRGWTK
jgi:hypothetical protein